MDAEKMAEGRRLAAIKRRQESEAQRAADEKQLEDELMKRERRLADEGKRRLEPATIHEFKKLRIQIKTFYDEISILSKKAPDGPLNKFKLKFLNDILVKTTALLGPEYRPFPDFESFSDPDLPSASDAALMLSHYISSMGRFYDGHTYMKDSTRKWYTKGDE